MIMKNNGKLIDTYTKNNNILNGEIKLRVHFKDEKKEKVRYNLFFNPNHK